MPIEFAAELMPDQIKQHLAWTFEVPPGATGLNLDFEYRPHRVEGRANLLTLTLFDPTGSFRGEGHKMPPAQQVAISRAAATPGYLVGDLPAGQWTVVINTHMILAPVHYRLAVEVSFEPQAVAASAAAGYTAPRGSTAPRGPGWYRGDLHAHTSHSDGQWGVPDLLAYAREERLDFATVSDHNTLSPLAEALGAASDDLLTLGGMELTTFYGHALALDVPRWVDWRVRPGERSMADIAAEVEAAGGWFIIAHPMAVGDPVCTGCDWQYTDVMPGPARAVEIWNSPWDEGDTRNEAALQLWYRWLNQGYKMVATAGSDIHERPTHPAQYGRDVVYTRELSAPALFDAARRGHLYLSAGPTLLLEAVAASGERGMMGDILPEGGAQVTAQWQGAPADGTLRWIVNGLAQQVQPCRESGEAHLALVQGWCVVELRDAGSSLLAITNPIFTGAGWR